MIYYFSNGHLINPFLIYYITHEGITFSHAKNALFSDDNRQEGKPVPIPSNTLDLFLMQCKSSEWKLHCLDCESSTKDTEIEQHLQKKHTLRANSEDTPVNDLHF